MARKKLQGKPKQDGLPLWIGTFGDLMSLLLTFFILLLSMATFDKEKVELAIGSLQGALSILERGRETEITQPTQIQASPLNTNSLQDNVMNVFSSLTDDYNEITKVTDGPGIDLEESQDGFIIRIPDDLLFESGSAVIANTSGRLFLERLAMELENYKDILNLKIIGNTDNVPYREGSAIDNWDLSNKRALSVAENLITLGIPPNIIQVGGDSYFNPIASNDDDFGRAKNRRVDINFSFVGNNIDTKEQVAKDIADKMKMEQDK